MQRRHSWSLNFSQLSQLPRRILHLHRFLRYYYIQTTTRREDTLAGGSERKGGEMCVF
jgi:hypothetical protein